MESIKNRTSIRKYAEKEVSEELLNRLLEEVRAHPDNGKPAALQRCGNKK